MQEGRDLAEHAGAPEQLGGAVLGGEQLLERVAARLPARAVGACLAFDAEQLVHAGARGVAASGGLGVYAGRSPADFVRRRRRLSDGSVPGAHRRHGNCLLGSLGALLSSAVRAPGAVCLSDRGLQTRRGRGGVAGQARNLLAVVGDDAVDAGELAGGGIVGVLGGLARASRGRQGRARLLDLARQRSILGTGDAGTLVERIGVLAARGQLGSRAQGDLLGRGHECAAQALSDRGQRLPVGGCLLERRRGRAFRILQARKLGARGGYLFLERHAAGFSRLVRCLEHGQLRKRRGQVVGEQAGLRVAHARLNEGGATSDPRLAGQGPQLAVNFVGQVQDAHEVRVHVGQLLERALLAPAMLQDASSLFDEPAALLGRGGQDRVELPLADDDVHLTAHARVGQKLLHVQQPRRSAVNGVFGAAPAEQGAADRHLGILDVEQTVGVVNREVHLGAPQRRAPRCPREDHVRHLPAAQRAGTLLAHDPGESVDDVGFTRPVGADDARDARLEGERGRTGEGLKAPQRQVLEVHPCRLAASQ